MNASLFALILSLVLFAVSWVFVVTRAEYGPVGLMVHIYHCIFLLGPGVAHVARNRFPFYGMQYMQDEVLSSSILVLTFTVAFLVSYHTLALVSGGKVFVRQIPILNEERAAAAIIILNVAQLVGIIVIGPSELMRTRDSIEAAAFGASTHAALLVASVVRGMSFVACLLLLHMYLLGKKVGTISLAVPTLALGFIINYPFALARFLLFAYILAALFISISSPRVLKIVVSVAFIVGITTIFPLISSLGRPDMDMGGVYFWESYVESGDFDGLQSIINCVTHVREYGLAWGSQLLGDIFVWVPRAVWAGKPEVTGVLVAQSAGYDMTNVSAPILSEFYFDFGYPGMLLGAALLAYISWKIDGWSCFKSSRSVPHFYLSAWIFGVTIILMRGSLMAVLGPIFVFSIVIFLVAYFVQAVDHRVVPTV